jgi:hypothetical protein
LGGGLSLREALDHSALEARQRDLKRTDQRHTATSVPKRNPTTQNIRQRPQYFLSSPWYKCNMQ